MTRAPAAPRPRTVTVLAAAAMLCLLAMVLLGLPFAGQRSPDPVDTAVAEGLTGWLGGAGWPARLLVLPTEPVVLLPMLAVVLLITCLRRRWPDAALAVLGPALAVAVNTWLLKPVFARYKDDGLVYPSGHTVSLVAVLILLALLARRGAARLLVLLAGTVLLLGAGAGMVLLGYHYATDVLGGACFAAAVLLGLRALQLRFAPAHSG